MTLLTLSSIILWVIVIGVIGFAVYAIIIITLDREKHEREVKALPAYRIVPVHSGRYGIEEKHVTRFGGMPSLVSWWPLFATYDTREQAEADLKHLNQGATP